MPLANGSIYSATKAALDAITISLSKELGPKNIRINSILPGGVETERAHNEGVVGSDFEKRMVTNTPLGRVGRPEDVSKVAVFVASDDSAWITVKKLWFQGDFTACNVLL
jgi:3-oxoacyl-[acyl-carrier protein] reductase